MKIIFLLCALSLMVACASNDALIMKKDDGSYVSSARDTETDSAMDEAKEGAELFCQKQNKTAVYIKDETKYTGKTDEETRNTIRKASKAGMIIGGGTPIGTAGTVGIIMTNDKDYKTQLHFRCE